MNTLVTSRGTQVTWGRWHLGALWQVLITDALSLVGMGISQLLRGGP